MGEIADEMIERMIWGSPFDGMGEYQGELEPRKTLTERCEEELKGKKARKAQKLNEDVIKW